MYAHGCNFHFCQINAVQRAEIEIKMMLLIRQNCGQRKLVVATCFLFICLF